MHLPGYRRRLWHQGAQAKGVVTESKMVPWLSLGWGSGSSSSTLLGSKSLYRLKLLVRFPDGSEREVKLLRKAYNPIPVGRTYPVRYDPNNLSNVVIDTPAFKETLEKVAHSDDEENLEQAKRELRGEKAP